MVITDVYPFISQLSAFKLRADGLFGKRLQGQGGHVHLQGYGAVFVHHRPGIWIPADRSEESFPSQQMMRAGLRAESETDHPPVSVGGLHEVSVSGTLNRTVLGILVNMG